MNLPFKTLIFALVGNWAFWLTNSAAAANAAVTDSTANPASIMALPRYPVRPPGDPVKIESGKGLYSVNCSFCHGANAKGGESGPNLVRSEIVLNDKNGEAIAQVVQNGIAGKGMPKFTLSDSQISDIAAFIHSFPVGEGARGVALIDPLVGNATAGAAFFNGVGGCSGCHSVTGDLAGIGGKYPPRDLQGMFLTGGRRGGGFPVVAVAQISIPPGTTAKVTLPSGKTYQGKLQYIDEFDVSIVDETRGGLITFPRAGDMPKLEIHDPLQKHFEMMRTLTDTQIHDLTAYLVTLK
jgi:mono/diheme cytochrome c family protein